VPTRTRDGLRRTDVLGCACHEWHDTAVIGD
jgi:hypothetical protein